MTGKDWAGVGNVCHAMSDEDGASLLPAETRARVRIDQQLTQAGWKVQDKRDLNLFAGQGIAVREVVMKPGHGRVDYLLYVDKAVVGVIEAKPMGTPLSGVEWQSAMYADGLPADVRLAAKTRDGRLPFVFEASGVETHFTNGFDPEPRARLIFNFPKPATLARILRDADAAPERPTWRAKVRDLPPLDADPLRPAQVEAIHGVEKSLADQHFDRSLVQMATGAGKTYTAVTESYRLLKYGGFNRILFLVDRNNLADQTLAEFQNYRTPDDGRRFTELYNVTKLSSAGLLGSSKIAVSTIQRVYKFLNDGEVSEVDDPNLDDFTPDAPVTVSYSQALPPETFDLVIVDAIGVTEHPFVEPPLNRQKSVSLKKLLDKAAALMLTEDEAATLASRLAKLELALTDEERRELDEVAGQPVRDIVRALVDAVDPSTGSADAIERAIEPIAANPELRNRILELRAAHDRVIDEVSSDELVEAGGVVDTDRARSIVESWRVYLDEHRDEITAIQVAYEAGEHRIDFAYIQGLAARIARPPHNWTPDIIWNAYAAIDAPKVRNCPTHTLTDLVPLIRYTIGVDDELVPYGERVREKYAAWLAQQEQAGVVFNDTERWWLDRMASVIANSAGIRVEDLDDAPFIERGGTDGALRDLGDRAGDLVEQLNTELTA